jgi:drug/metabolite transporter (DMT)-like permease
MWSEIATVRIVLRAIAIVGALATVLGATMAIIGWSLAQGSAEPGHQTGRILFTPGLLLGLSGAVLWASASVTRRIISRGAERSASPSARQN